MLTNFLLITVLIIMLLEAYVIFALIKLIRSFLGEIKSIKGIQFGSLEIGEPAPQFRAVNHRNEKIVLKDIIQDKDTVILFVSATCATCKEVISNLNKLMFNGDSNILVITKETISFSDNIIKQPSINIIQAPYLFSSYHVSAVPYLVKLDNNGDVQFNSEIKSFAHLNNLITPENTYAV